MINNRGAKNYLPLRDQGRIGAINVKSRDAESHRGYGKMPDKKAINSVSGLKNREVKSKSMGREEDIPDLKKPV